MGYGGIPHGHHLSSSSSSSTLSPLAPPFTVGRGGARAAPLPYDPYASSRSEGQDSSDIRLDLPPPCRISSADVSPYFGHEQTTATAGYCGVSSGNLAKVEPYYPRYLSSSGSGIQSLDRDCRDVSPIGQSVVLPSTPFDVGIEADAAGSSLWGGAYGGNWQEEDNDLASGDHLFKSGDLSGIKVDKSSGTSSFSRGTSHLSLNTPVEEYIPYSSVQLSFSSKYISEVDTMKSDPVKLYKVAPYKENSVGHGDSFKNPNSQSRDAYSETKKTEVLTAKSSSVKITAPPIIGSKIKISKDRVDGKFDIKTENPENNENISPDVLDEHLVIDSPCWKGALSSRNHASLGGMFDNFLQASSDYSIAESEGLSRVPSFPREVGNNTFCGRFHGENCPKTIEKLSFEEFIGTSTAEPVAQMGNLISDPFCFPDLDNLMPSVLPKHDRVDGMVQPPPTSDSSSILNPSSPINAQLLVETIHNLSSVLVTTCSFSENGLEERERELLQSTVNNLERYISRKIEDRTRPETSCSVRCSQEEPITYPKESPKENFSSLSSGSLDEHGRKRGTHTNLSNSEQPTEGIGDDLWCGVDDAVDQLKHKLDAIRSDPGTSKVLERPKLPGQSAKEQIPPMKLKARESEVKPIEPLPLTRPAVDVDPAVMDRFRVLKDRMQRVDFFDKEQSGSSCGRVDFESGPSTHARAPGSSSARRFTDFPFGSSDWEHVLKEELT